MNQQKIKQQKKQLRRIRTRAKIFGTALKPRLSVFKSLRHTSAQLIDDQKGQTLVNVSFVENKPQNNNTKTDHARALGELLAKKALTQKITTCVFDKGSYKYHGRIKALADGARTGGLKF